MKQKFETKLRPMYVSHFETHPAVAPKPSCRATLKPCCILNIFGEIHDIFKNTFMKQQ